MWRMDGKSRKVRLAAWVQTAVQLCLCIAPLAAQEGYISIDCGCNSSYVDSVTGITWVSDEGYISTGVNSNQLSSKKSTPDNATQLWDLRYFPENRKRECYLLQVDANATYLVRSMFLYSYFSTVVSTLSFDLYVNAMFWTTVSYGEFSGSGAPNLDTPQTYEMVFRSEGTALSICLVRDQGSPFISSLELRKLEDSMYDVVQAGDIICLQSRFNFGANPGTNGLTDNVRYPDDQYDRIWPNYGSIDHTDCPADMRNTTYLIPSEDGNRPPVKVMEDACIAFNSSIVLSFSFPRTVQEYYAILYIQEIDGNISARNPRGLIITVSNTQSQYGVNTVLNVTSTVSQVAAPASANLSNYLFSVTISRALWSTLDPIVNAAEFYIKTISNTSDTDNVDVSALDALRLSLNLMSWTGDPCFPVSWDWINCDYSIMPSRVTAVNLTDMGIAGSISPTIASLTQLTDLWLDSNYLTGSIPNLSALTHLQTLRLQNNSLTGAFPGYLFQLPNLTLLDVESNNLLGSVPACPKQSILTFKCDGNLHLQCSSGLQNCGKGSSSSMRAVLTIVGALLGVALLTIIVLLGCCYWRRKRRANLKRSEPLLHLQQKSKFVNLSSEQKDRAPSFTFEETIKATNNFAKKIGEGSFGAVYYGKLPSGKEVAVKVNTGKSRQGTAEFVNEVNLLSRVHHKNLVSLLGYCEESEEQVLIYAYMAKGTLRQHLYGTQSAGAGAGEGSPLNKPLDWMSRLNIAISSAKGLEYLHIDCNPGIIHRDVKSSNILLDDKLVAKVADFGLSKSGPETDFTSGFSTAVKGTFGYFDPEYFSSQRLTQKSDVYSFGVVLLEIVSGRPPHHFELPDGSLRTLVEFMRVSLQNDIFVIVDAQLEGKYNPASMRKVIELAASCVQDRGINRPDMRHVVQRLLSAWDLECPPSNGNSNSNSGSSSPQDASYFSASHFSGSSSSAISSAPSSCAYMSTDPSYTQGR